MHFKNILAFIFFLQILWLQGQNQTVGLFLNDSLSYNGYTLFAPVSSRTTYLIDNCGYKINEWNSTANPGMSAYLLEDGSLLRAGRVFANFAAGGSGGLIEIISWEDELMWSYRIADENMHQHHDIAVLPNGNILAVVWEQRPVADAVQAGRDPSSIGNSGVWFEKIMEIKPVGSDEAEIVWEWYLFDHLIQDIDSTKNNYGVIADHPELIDINSNNMQGGGPGTADWFHTNSIDYNEALDQIVFSSRPLNEVFIIDHSTTSEEAASHSGGNAGKGGDILYRWGNPEIYHRGDHEDQRLYGQHDAHWIPGGRPGAGSIMIFNNGAGRPEGNFSTIEVIDPPLNGYNYDLEDGKKYGPEEALWTFEGSGNTGFYSSRISGAQRQPNGNTLICSGNQYRIFEVDPDGKLVWDYINPVNQNGGVSQGSLSSSRDMFRAYRYGPDYPAFEGKDMTPGDPLESNPVPYLCNIYDMTTSVNEQLSLPGDFQIFPNPSHDIVNFSGTYLKDHTLIITDITGKIIESRSPGQYNSTTLNISSYNPGIYFVKSGEITKRMVVSP